MLLIFWHSNDFILGVRNYGHLGGFWNDTCIWCHTSNTYECSWKMNRILMSYLGEKLRVPISYKQKGAVKKRKIASSQPLPCFSVHWETLCNDEHRTPIPCMHLGHVLSCNENQAELSFHHKLFNFPQILCSSQSFEYSQWTASHSYPFFRPDSQCLLKHKD